MLASPFAWGHETCLWSRAGRDAVLASVPKKSRKGPWLQKLLGASLLSLELGWPFCSTGLADGSFWDFLATSVFLGFGALLCPSSLPFQSIEGCLSFNATE